MKDLIVINAYTPDTQRLKILQNFLTQLNSKKEFDIMVVSHSPIPEYFYEYFDYFVYEKSNIVLKDLKYKYLTEYRTENWKLITTESTPFNHFIAAYRLFYLGLINAKKLNYKKVHFIEYDTIIESTGFFKHNSDLLEINSLVCYKRNSPPFLLSFPMSFNVEKLESYWFDYNEVDVYEFLEKKDLKTLEAYLQYLIDNQPFCFFESREKINQSGIKINIHSSNPNPNWICPVVDGDKFILFVLNKQDIFFNIKYIINDEPNIHNKTIESGHWYFMYLCEYDDIETLQVITNNNHIINYDFKNIDKVLYKEKNKLIK